MWWLGVVTVGSVVTMRSVVWLVMALYRDTYVCMHNGHTSVTQLSHIHILVTHAHHMLVTHASVDTHTHTTTTPLVKHTTTPL